MSYQNTLQTLKKRLEANTLLRSQREQSKLEELKDLPFYCEWLPKIPLLQKNSKGYCCFNHAVGLPIKDTARPLYKWQKEYLFDNLEQHKYNWVKKAAGIGCSEIVLRYIAWKCLVNDKWQGGNVCIVTGPNERLAIRLIDERLKPMFYNLGITFDTEKRVLILNECHIEAYASNHLDSMRSLTNVKFIFLDEADFFPPGEQQDSRHISERYIAKSDVSILMCSTPNAPGQLYETIENEKDCLYNKIYLPWQIGLGNIYSKEEIAAQRKSPSFAREYELQYLGGIGNVFNFLDIEAAVNSPYEINVQNPYSVRFCGIDPAFGSSMYAVCVIEWYNNAFQVLLAEEWSRPLFQEAIEKVISLIESYNISKIMVDGANPEVIHSLKKYYPQTEFLNYETIEDPKIVERWAFTDSENNKICPVNFRLKHKEMLQRAELILSKRRMRINPKFNKLTTSLRTALAKGEWDLDKTQTAYNDILDAYMLAQIPAQFNFRSS